MLLDVDDVVNPLGDDLPYGVPAEWTTTVVPVDGVDYPVRVHASVPVFLARLHSLTDVRWLTTWSRHGLCNSTIAPLVGLPELPVQARERYRHSSKYANPASPHWWKRSAVQELAEREPDRAIVWVDDDATSCPMAAPWLSCARQLRPAPVHAVVPARGVGLTTRDMEEIIGRVEDAERGART